MCHKPQASSNYANDADEDRFEHGALAEGYRHVGRRLHVVTPKERRHYDVTVEPCYNGRLKSSLLFRNIGIFGIKDNL